MITKRKNNIWSLPFQNFWKNLPCCFMRRITCHSTSNFQYPDKSHPQKHFQIHVSPVIIKILKFWWNYRPLNEMYFNSLLLNPILHHFVYLLWNISVIFFWFRLYFSIFSLNSFECPIFLPNSRNDGNKCTKVDH